MDLLHAIDFVLCHLLAGQPLLHRPHISTHDFVFDFSRLTLQTGVRESCVHTRESVARCPAFLSCIRVVGRGEGGEVVEGERYG